MKAFQLPFDLVCAGESIALWCSMIKAVCSSIHWFISCQNFTYISMTTFPFSSQNVICTTIFVSQFYNIKITYCTTALCDLYFILNYPGVLISFLFICASLCWIWLLWDVVNVNASWRWCLLFTFIGDIFLLSEGNGEDAAIYLFYRPILFFPDHNFFSSRVSWNLRYCAPLFFFTHSLGIVVHACFAKAGAVF